MFAPSALILAYELGARAARMRVPSSNCPFLDEDWRRATAWLQGHRDMRQLLDDVRDLVE